MTPDRHDDTPDDQAEHGMLTDAGAMDTASIGILRGGTAQVSVSLPLHDEDDLVHDDAVADEVPVEEIATGDIILEGGVLGADAPATAALEDVHDAEEVPDTGAIAAATVVHSEADESIEDDETRAVGERVAADETFAADESLADAESGADTEPLADAEPVADAARAADAEPGPTGMPRRVPVGDPVTLTGSIPTTRRAAYHADDHHRGGAAHAVEHVSTPAPAVTLTSKRLGDLDDQRESSDLLTADRLLGPRQISGAEPEGVWQQLVYSLTRHRINLGDSRKARARKDLDRRIAAPLPGGARFVPVLSRKGGVGKTTITTLLGMALASARDDRVIAVDANPDRGTLADRIGRAGGRTVRDLARTRGDVTGYSDISTVVARDETRLDVLASDADPHVSEAFSDRDYHDVASLAAHYYSIVLTDTGTGIVHSVMGATLELADQIVVVAGLSVDEARLASETLTWLETNGYAEQVRNAVVVLNTARPGTPLVRESELEAHFRTRVRRVVRMPYDPLIGAGSAISFRDLQPATRTAARELAAAVVEGLRTMVPAA